MSTDLSREQDAPDDPPESEAARSVVTLQALSFSGPLPPPEVLRQYDHIIPGAAGRILQMAEQQSDHRRGLERLSVESAVRDAEAQRRELRIGQWLGFIIALVAIAGGSLAAIFSPGTAGQIGGAVIGGGALVSLVSVFVTGGGRGGSRTRHDTNQGA